MGCDLFNNNTGGYVNPGLAPCAGDNDNNNLEFIDKGIGIVSGSEIKSFIDFSDLSIPVISWNNQIQNLGAGEVIFIQGLTKGLTYRNQGFTLPTLTSTNESLNPFFMEIDLSINYYKNFAFIKENIEASTNYNANINITTALNAEFASSSINAISSYDASTISFTGTMQGYQFDIFSVYLNVIDASQDINSPFPSIVIDGQRVQQTWKLEENPDRNVESAKYPNTASRGIILKAAYPSDDTGNYICDIDKWVYINHAESTIDLCEEVELNFNTDVSCLIVIGFDGSTFLGIKPIIIEDVSIADSSSGIVPDDPSSIIVIDGSIFIDGSIISSTVLFDYTLMDSSILDSSIFNSSIFYGSFRDSFSSNVFFTSTDIYDSLLSTDSSKSNGIISSTVWDSSLNNINTEDSLFIDSSIRISDASVTFFKNDVSGGSLLVSSGSLLAGDSSSSNFIHDNFIQGVMDIKNYDIYDSSLSTTGTFYNVNLSNSDVSSLITTFQESSINNISFPGVNVFVDSYIEDASLIMMASNNTSMTDIYLDTSLAASFINNSLIFDSSLSNISGVGLEIEDTSIFGSGIIEANMNLSEMNDSSISLSKIVNTEFILSTISDSSILNSTFNNSTKVSNSIINNSWSNVFVLVTNPSTGDKIYVMEDDTLDLDSSAWRVNIYESLIWDSSFNNTTVYDSSLYRTYLQDSSLVRCTTYNCVFDESAEFDTRTVMIDASIYSDVSISSDTSIFYTKTTKKVDVGLSGCSSDDTISAGDYLNWVTVNDHWKKVGDLYAWTGAADSSSSVNLIPGFYVYNAHTFPISVEYMVFV